MTASLDRLLSDIRTCRICCDCPNGKPLPHEPRPVLRVSPTARIAICGQAPGTRVHESGIPFTDPSGDRLRQWMGVSEAEFYDTSRVAIIPMGFCFPGLDAKGGDLPPRRECARQWRDQVFDHLTGLEIVLLVGQYAQRWHLGNACGPTLTETVRRWRDYLDGPDAGAPMFIPMPHPSWRNNAWLRKNPWFGEDILPFVQAGVRQALEKG